VRKGDVARTKELLAGGADPLETCSDLVSASVSGGVLMGMERMPALLIAARGEEPTLIELLLAAHAPVDARDEDGQTALMVAARGAYARVVKTLLSMGANANERDKRGRTALMLVNDEPSLSATMQNAAGLKDAADTTLRKTFAAGVEIVDALLAAGADVDAVDSAGRTALLLARTSGRTHIVNALLKADTVPDGNPASESALRLAFLAGYLDLFGNALADRGGKEAGGKYVTRAGMMRDAAQRNIPSHEEFLRNVDDGIQRAMNDDTSLDNRVLVQMVLDHEREGLALLISLAGASSGGAGAETDSAGSNPESVDQLQAFVEQLPQGSTAAAAALNETYATSGIPFWYWVARGAEPTALAGVHVRPHPCGRVAVLQSPTILLKRTSIDSDVVFEVDKAGRTIRSWPVPVDQTPDGVDGDELLLPLFTGGRKDLSIAVKPNGRYRVVPARGNRTAPARAMCPPHTLLGGSAYAQCMLVRDDASQQTGRYLVYEAPCS
jgi:hypothetical protein